MLVEYIEWKMSKNEPVFISIPSKQIDGIIGGFAIKSHSKDDVLIPVKHQIEPYRHGGVSYKVFAVPVADEDKLKYGRESFYTSDLESLCLPHKNEKTDFKVEGFNQELKVHMRKIANDAWKNHGENPNIHPEGTLEHFVFNKEAQASKESHAYNLRVAEAEAEENNEEDENTGLKM